MSFNTKRGLYLALFFLLKPVMFQTYLKKEHYRNTYTRFFASFKYILIAYSSVCLDLSLCKSMSIFNFLEKSCI